MATKAFCVFLYSINTSIPKSLSLMFSESEYPSHLTVQVPPRGVSKAADEVLPCHCCCHLGCVPSFFFYEYQGKRHWGRWWESLGQALIAQQICALLHFFNTAEPRAFLPPKNHASCKFDTLCNVLLRVDCKPALGFTNTSNLHRSSWISSVAAPGVVLGQSWQGWL